MYNQLPIGTLDGQFFVVVSGGGIPQTSNEIYVFICGSDETATRFVSGLVGITALLTISFAFKILLFNFFSTLVMTRVVTHKKVTTHFPHDVTRR